MGSNISPSNLVLRCYMRRMGDNHWYGIVLDFNLAAEATNPDELKNKLNEMIQTYVSSVTDTTDRDSIPQLLSRKAPFHDWVLYYAVGLAQYIKKIPNRFTFKEYIPFHLAHN